LRSISVSVGFNNNTLLFELCVAENYLVIVIVLFGTDKAIKVNTIEQYTAPNRTGHKGLKNNL